MLTVSTQITRDDDLSVFARMLDSVAFADELVIFNMERTDPAFAQLAKKYSANIINIKTPRIVEQIRTQQIKAAKGDWVLVMDYDEIVTPALAEELTTLMHNTGACGAYSIPRDNYSLGFKLAHGGWERDYVVRFIRRQDFVAWPTNIHSTPKVKGGIFKTTHAMEHHKDSSLAQMIAKTNRYSAIEAEQFFQGGLPPVTPLTLFRKPTMEFIRRYLLRRGFLDGSIGLIQSLYQAYSVFISYAKLYELQHQKV